MTRVKRASKLPSIFTAFDWVREARGAYVDCDEDLEAVNWHIRLLNSAADLAEMDCHYSIHLARGVPDGAETADGTSDRLFNTTLYYWNLYDVNYLLKGAQPAEAVPIGEAGFDEDSLILLAHHDRYLAYVRALEEYADKPKGYYFPLELENDLKDFEGRHAGHAKLRKKLLRLRGGAAKAASSPQVSESARNLVLQHHDYKCIFDGRGRPEFSMNVHHVIPRRMIERLSLPDRLHTARENLVACCAGCNIVKSDTISPADISFYLEQFASPQHPNNPILEHLEKIRSLQLLP